MSMVSVITTNKKHHTNKKKHQGNNTTIGATPKRNTGLANFKTAIPPQRQQVLHNKLPKLDRDMERFGRNQSHVA